MYPKSDGNGSLSDASTIPKDGYASVEVFAGDDLHYQTMNPKGRLHRGSCLLLWKPKKKNKADAAQNEQGGGQGPRTTLTTHRRSGW
jgi:hypothetical protein